jgi:hypothetical protein
MGRWLDQSTVKLEIDQLSNNNKILKNGGTAFFLDMDGWMGETVFSLMKIINRECFGVYVSARKFPNMIKEFMKGSLYNVFNG